MRRNHRGVLGETLEGAGRGAVAVALALLPVVGPFLAGVTGSAYATARVAVFALLLGGIGVFMILRMTVERAGFEGEWTFLLLYGSFIAGWLGGLGVASLHRGDEEARHGG